ncbi:MAG: polyprenyl synthetase family protein [Candidatus Subteraquimicrobiales bacterium]|nr:polyprenyl synthetase family protein [Candidatus Subteraquimicrobiales bacterium]
MKAQTKKKATYPEDKRLLVEESLRKYFPKENTYPDLIYRAMGHSLFSGGKRFRPILTLLCAKVFLSDTQSAKLEEVLPIACAVEYIHTYSLIHDDLPVIDNDLLRRGKPTCHVVFGEDIAILAGDALLTEAFSLISSSKLSPDKIVRVISELSEASGVRGMIGGQVVDILSTRKPIDLSTLEYIHEHKTGCLIKASARIGAIFLDAGEEDLELITEYAHHLGMIFQITDDILNVIGKTETMGKAKGSDKRLKKATFPALLGLKKSYELVEEHLRKAIENLDKISKDTSELVNLAYFVVEREK